MNDSSPRLLRAACAVGLLHASFSLYWGLGGRWLLDTVGAWAVDLAERAPVQAGIVLIVVAAVKAGGAVLPLLLVAGRVWQPRLWRAICLLGGGVLVVYGLLNTVVAWLVLSGTVTPAGGYDRVAMIGHAALWDPLFLVWGLLLLAGLGTRRAMPNRTARGTCSADVKRRCLRRLDTSNGVVCDASAGFVRPSAASVLLRAERG